MARRTDERGRAYKQSQFQMQIYVNRREEALSAAVIAALPTLAALEPRQSSSDWWCSDRR
jgi:hypothetical protein